jgi:hypothetical protein
MVGSYPGPAGLAAAAGHDIRVAFKEVSQEAADCDAVATVITDQSSHLDT